MVTKKKLEDKLIEGFTTEEAKAILKAFRSKPEEEKKTYNLIGNSFKFGIISDTHIGHKNYDEGMMDLAAKEFNKRKVDFVLHCGDVCDGLYTNSRPEQIYELNQVGLDQQLEKAISELGKIEQPLYFITGNHSQNTFMKYAGIEIGKHIDKALENAHFLGNANGNITLDDGLKINLLHPDGGTAYALSYRPQKIAESLSGGSKPNIMCIGHFHKAEYLFYRNIHIYQAGTFESQTNFMKNKNLSAHKSFWIVDLRIKNGEVKKIQSTLYPFYD